MTESEEVPRTEDGVTVRGEGWSFWVPARAYHELHRKWREAAEVAPDLDVSAIVDRLTNLLADDVGIYDRDAAEALVRSIAAPPETALRIEYTTGRRHGYEEGYRAASALPLEVERLGLALAKHWYDHPSAGYSYGHCASEVAAEYARLSKSGSSPSGSAVYAASEEPNPPTRTDNLIFHWPNDPRIAGCNEHCHRAERGESGSPTDHDCLMPSACGVTGFYCANSRGEERP